MLLWAVKLKIGNKTNLTKNTRNLYNRNQVINKGACGFNANNQK